MHDVVDRVRARRRFILLLIWLAAGGLMGIGVMRQSSRLNLSATAGGQYPYLLYAQGMAEEGWWGFLGDRNRMPLYPALLSLAHHADWSTFVERSRIAAIGWSMLFLVMTVTTVYAVLPVWPATAVGLMAAFLIFLPTASFVQAELVYYFLFLLSCLLLFDVLRQPRRLTAVAAGVGCGLAYLAKASALPLLGAFLIACAFRLHASCRTFSRPRQQRDSAISPSNGPSEDSSEHFSKSYADGPRTECMETPVQSRGLKPAAQNTITRNALAKDLLALLLVPIAYVLVAFPYLYTNYSIFGRLFYNVNSTYFLWCDHWEQASSFASRYGIERHPPRAPDSEIPSPSYYWNTHTLREIAHRVFYGLTSLAELAWRGAYFKYLILSGILWAAVRFRRSRVHPTKLRRIISVGSAFEKNPGEGSRELTPTTRNTTTGIPNPADQGGIALSETCRVPASIIVFVVLAGLGYLLGYAWYVPIAYGDRFIRSLFLPTVVLLWWSAGRSVDSESTAGAGRSRRSLVNVVAIALIPVLLMEGVYAASVRCVQPTREFITFYYNESVERRRAGDLVEAEQGFRGVAELAPAWAAPRHDLGMIALALGKTDQAVAWLSEAARLEATNPDLWNSLGGAYVATERWTDAVDAFRRATELDPSLAIAWYNLGGTYARIGDQTRAYEVLERLSALNGELSRQLERLLSE